MGAKKEEEFLDDLSKNLMDTLKNGLESGRFVTVDSIEGDPWNRSESSGNEQEAFPAPQNLIRLR